MIQGYLRLPAARAAPGRGDAVRRMLHRSAEAEGSSLLEMEREFSRQNTGMIGYRPSTATGARARTWRGSFVLPEFQPLREAPKRRSVRVRG
jgi:hypothetical protein